MNAITTMNTEINTMNTEINPMINSLWIIVLLCFVFCLLCYRCFTEKKQMQNDITELKSLLINREIELKKEMKEMKNEINDLKSLFLHFEVNLVELDKRENERWNKQINEDAPNLLTTILESNEMVMTKIEQDKQDKQDKQYQENKRKYEKELNEMIMNEIHNLKVEMNKHENDKHEQEKEEDRLKNEMDIAFPLTIVPLTIIDELTFMDELILCNKDTTDLTYSHINVCKINNQIINIQKYRPLLLHLYYKTDRSTILRIPKSKLKIKPGDFRENNFRVNEGYIYDKKLDLSIQRGDSSKILTEIINIIRKNNYNMELTIENKIGEIINFRM